MYVAKKKFGQNFLKDDFIKAQIIQAIPKLDENIQLVEIGPGLGDLTECILKQGFCLDAYEIDRDLIPILKERFGNFKFNLINADFLEVSINKDFFVCANLPYYVSSSIITKLIFDPFCKGMIVMIQKELAQRFLGDDYCALSVLVELTCSKHLVCDVAPSAFEPMPKVNSSVIKLVKDKQIDFNLDEFNKFLKQAFLNPRKKVLKSLNAYEEIFKQLNLDTNLRAHEISAKSFLEIFKKGLKNG
ncbi:16S rRNA (adenine(1518)-N(6)/adenine(1519)-N(6))-dimethyltransferase RsmA [Campylobacter canadensis]|uniref:Ribosomal RNA small subunit methyltransferase A n=1 Tax=Campylobacter canadensis TaxID=449520 RepID=A0ABS7WR13_9BACT|nr:16S rRNA (adenine(1518)-N(6)/adenine(1519)-N(6))-dimethyltransferase RsmA [Campylobacter canadensis]MBZ7987179.1 ribosomal RNA small subunit methyltransferase A [Campylobacter canadensis]MBZ7998197.1 ribosomal RNA small subunit methyltransferase A [Campylobacter canadensis]